MPMMRLFMMLLVIPSGISKHKVCVFEYAYTSTQCLYMYLFLMLKAGTVIMNMHFDVLHHIYNLLIQRGDSACHRTPCFSYSTCVQCVHVARCFCYLFILSFLH